MKKILIKENFTSNNLFDKLNLLKENQVVDILNGIDWTVENYPSAVIIGGTAVVHYLKGGRDLTPDIDFLVESLNTVKKKLEIDGFKYNSIKSDKGNLGITVPDFNTDYLDSNIGNVAVNRAILKTYKTTNINGVNVNIIIPELLAIMKLELGRNKDIDDGLALITSKKLNKSVYLKLVEGLKNYLIDYDSLISYSEMI